ncbi:MAG: pilus assembly protein PilM [Eubacterium sp.]|nr:pilus assembly protein PilM [Eubacterium sp.]
MAKKVIVVRIGTSEVQIVHMEDTNSYPTVYGCVRFPTPENAVKDGFIADVSELAVRIRKACADKGIRTKDVIFTVASGKIASREMSIPMVKKKAKIHPLVMAKVPDLFPIDAEKYIFSYVTQGKPHEDGEDGMVQDVMVFAAPSELIDSYYTLADAAGLRIVSIEADGNAVFQVMRQQVKSSKGVSMSVQINQSATLVNIISDDKLLLQRVVPYGINVFTEVLIQEPAFQVQTEEDAYTLLKRNRVILHNLNLANPENNPSLEKRIEVTDNASFLIGNIGRVIEYYNSKYKDRPIEEIICMGQGCAVAGIHELLSNELGIPTHTPSELAGVRFNRRVNINAYILQYVNCFGAVYNPVNFVAKSIALREEKKGSLTGSVIAFGGFICLSLLLAGFSIFQLFQSRSDNATWTNRCEAMSPIQNEYESLLEIEVNRKMIDVVDLIPKTNNNRFHDLLKKIEAQCPNTFNIQSFSSDEDKVTVNAVSTDKLLSISALQIQLNKVDGIRNVKIDSITETNEAMTKRKQYSYTITFDYTALTDANEKASELTGNQTE